ncbi:pilus assembly protein PilZ [Acidithiobacillus ferrivorans]|nr:pilus assembly protein PilZ [Acidithiobacillus ferrivorans]
MELQSESSGAAKALSVVLRDDLAVQRYYMPHIKGGGILVETQNLLPMGTEVLLMLTLPDSQSRAAVMGKVVWVTPKDNREGRQAAIGIQFANDRHGVHTRIQNILSGLPMCSDNILTF